MSQDTRSNEYVQTNQEIRTAITIQAILKCGKTDVV